MERDEAPTAGGWDEKHFGDKMFFTWTRRMSSSRYSQASPTAPERKDCGKHSPDDWSSLIFLFAGQDQFNLRMAAHSRHYIKPFPLLPIIHISLRFTLLPINIWKSSLTQIKFLQHFLQRRYVLLWKLRKCHKIQKPRALLHEENPDHPKFPPWIIWWSNLLGLLKKKVTIIVVGGGCFFFFGIALNYWIFH